MDEEPPRGNATANLLLLLLLLLLLILLLLLQGCKHASRIRLLG